MKNRFQAVVQYTSNAFQILRDKRHEQKSKALAFSLIYSILPILLFINLTITYLPNQFLDMIESLLTFLPDQYQKSTIEFLHNISYHQINPIIYIGLVLFILYTIATNVRLVIEISNDCYEYSSERSKNKELIISALLFIFITFGVLSLFAVVMAGQALRSFLELDNVTSIVVMVNKILDMKSLITVFILFMVFYITYYFAPNVKSTFKSTIVGTLVSTIGLFFASYGFEVYLAKSSTYEILYGAVYSQYLLFLFGMYIICQIIVASIIINSLIYEKISIKNYHIDHGKGVIDIGFETVHMSLDDLKNEIREELIKEETTTEK